MQLWNSAIARSCDYWKTTDVYGEIDWEKELRMDYYEQLVRKDHPHLEDEAIRILAEERMEDDDHMIYWDCDF